MSDELGARVIYHDADCWGIVMNKHIKESEGVKRCIDLCAEVFNLIKQKFDIRFVVPSVECAIPSEHMERIIRFLQCLDVCMYESMKYKLEEYDIYVGIVPYLLVASFASDWFTDNIEIMLAIAPKCDDKEYNRIIKELKSGYSG